MNRLFTRWTTATLVLGLALGLGACDQKAIGELEEGVSTEADVRERFGAPEAVWDGPDGAQVYEYNRQPAGHQNYQITIGADGKMAAFKQVLNARSFAMIQPGMPMEDVRKLLGKPMKITVFDLKKETHYDWRWRDGPNESDSQVFTVIFNPDLRVISTLSVRDPELDRGR